MVITSHFTVPVGTPPRNIDVPEVAGDGGPTRAGWRDADDDCAGICAAAGSTAQAATTSSVIVTRTGLTRCLSRPAVGSTRRGREVPVECSETGGAIAE